MAIRLKKSLQHRIFPKCTFFRFFLQKRVYFRFWVRNRQLCKNDKIYVLRLIIRVFADFDTKMGILIKIENFCRNRPGLPGLVWPAWIRLKKSLQHRIFRNVRFWRFFLQKRAYFRFWVRNRPLCKNDTIYVLRLIIRFFADFDTKIKGMTHNFDKNRAFLPKSTNLDHIRSLGGPLDVADGLNSP